jgi:hypothetical protein
MIYAPQGQSPCIEMCDEVVSHCPNYNRSTLSPISAFPGTASSGWKFCQQMMQADSVSGYIAQVLAEHEGRESLRALLRDLIEQYDEPAAKDIKWAERALPTRRG